MATRDQNEKPYDSYEEFEKAIAKAPEDRHYVLRLYVAGMTPNSARAIANIKRICEERLQGRYELDVIDIYQNPVLGDGEKIVAAPTLIKQLPPPLRKMIGDMSDEEKVLIGLDLTPREEK